MFNYIKGQAANKKKKEPAIFESIPQFKSDCLAFITTNFDNFVVHMFRDQVIDVLISKHIDRIKVELSQYGLDEADSPKLIILYYYNDSTSKGIGLL